MSQSSSLIGERLGSRYPYKIESVLGSGAMGVVYRATDEKRARLAAVKVISNELAQGEKVKKRFEREYEILNQFRHPGIVRNFACGRFRGTLYIAMEFIQGETLEKILQDRGAMPWREVVELGIQVCDALHYAHERGVVHRDLKPSNLMITAEQKVKLTDFGIAKDLDATALTATGRTLGTAAYMSPEQIRGTPAISHKTDLYSLGIVLYQMLVGKPPFEGNSPVVLMHCHLNEPPPRPSSKVHEIPKALDDLVVSLMAKAPQDRPWDAAAVAVTLGELREKADRGVSIPMVWPTTGTATPGSSSRGGSVASERSRKKTRKTSSIATLASSLFATRSRGTSGDSGSTRLTRAALETALLALALITVGGFIVYWIWPPSAAYLFGQAETLMASERRADWVTAVEEYVDPLDHRFPDNPYREQTQKWRDQIVLHDAEGRARILTAPVKTNFSEPNNNAERQYVITHQVAAQASARHDDLKAMDEWEKTAKLLNPKDPDERPWYLLALHHAAQLDHAIKDRREYVLKQLQIAEEAMNARRPDVAITIRNKLIEDYKDYTDLADIFPATPVAPSPGAAKEPSTPGAAPAGPPSGLAPAEPSPAPPPRHAAGQAETEAPRPSPHPSAEPDNQQHDRPSSRPDPGS